MHSLMLSACSPHIETSTNNQEATQQTRTGKLISAKAKYLGCICWAGFIWISFPSWLPGTSVPAHTGGVFGAGRSWDCFWQWMQLRCQSRRGTEPPDAARGTFSPAGFAEVLGNLALPVPPPPLAVAVSFNLCGAPTSVSFQQESSVVT